jgi:nucleotidyltransferase/DNA polymerase involved in DNA repair
VIDAFPRRANDRATYPSSQIAMRIKDRIRIETGLIASAGAHKYPAKLASDIGELDGFVVLEAGAEGSKGHFLMP